MELFIQHSVKFQKTFKIDMNKIIKSLAFSSFISTDEMKWSLSHLCIYFFGGLLHFILKLQKHSIYSVNDEMKIFISISKEVGKISRPKISRTSMDQSDWQDESRNSGRQIKRPFMEPEVSPPTLWVNQFNSKFSPVATLINLSVPSSFSDENFYTHFPSPPVSFHNI